MEGSLLGGGAGWWSVLLFGKETQKVVIMPWSNVGPMSCEGSVTWQARMGARYLLPPSSSAHLQPEERTTNIQNNLT